MLTNILASAAHISKYYCGKELCHTPHVRWGGLWRWSIIRSAEVFSVCSCK